jgi:hypothetical protein
MRDDVPDYVCVADNIEIETPIPVDAGLPDVVFLVVFFGFERRMAKVQFEELHLLEKRFADRSRSVFQGVKRFGQII